MHSKAVFIGWLISLDIDQYIKTAAESAHLVAGIASYANWNQAVLVGLLVSFAVVARVVAFIVVLCVCYVSVIGVIVAIVVEVGVGPAQELTASAVTNGLSREYSYFGQDLAKLINLWLIPDDERRWVNSCHRERPDGNIGHNSRHHLNFTLGGWRRLFSLNCVSKQV